MITEHNDPAATPNHKGAAVILFAELRKKAEATSGLWSNKATAPHPALALSYNTDAGAPPCFELTLHRLDSIGLGVKPIPGIFDPTYLLVCFFCRTFMN